MTHPTNNTNRQMPTTEIQNVGLPPSLEVRWGYSGPILRWEIF